jgi:ABC-2 type transport system ATP-binding protein
MNGILINQIQKKVDKHFSLGPIQTKLPAGNVIALAGQNGSGKTTLLQLLMGLIKPDNGEARVFGHTAGSLEAKKETAYLSQGMELHGKFSPMQLADLYRLSFGDWSERSFAEYMKKFRVPAQKKLDSLSGGMQRKAMLGLHLSRRSTFFLMDEPYTDLDFGGQKPLDQEVVNYMERGESQTILFSTHSGEEMKRIADYILLMDDGMMIGLYEKDQLQESWKRIWITQPVHETEPVQGLVRTDAGGTELITEDYPATLEVLNRYGIEVNHMQAMDLREILTELGKKEKRVLSQKLS